MKDIEWWKKIKWKQFLFPHWFIIVAFVLISAVLLIYSLGYKNANPIIAYCSYVFSAYTLTIVVARMPAFIKRIKQGVHANKYSSRYVSEPELRAEVSLYIGNGMNVLYAIVHIITGIAYASVWSGTLAGYYIILSLIRSGLVKKDRMRLRIEDERERRLYELKSGYACGRLLFVLNLAVSALVVQMIWQNKYYDYPGFMVYAHAAYAFYSFIMALINMLKHRKLEKPIFSAAKVVSMSCALMSILALQTALLMQFGNGQAAFARLMNSLTGFAVCFNVFAMAVWLVHKTKKEIRLLKRQ